MWVESVNLGDDADTVGAIYGQLAGAHYGRGCIPSHWNDLCTFNPLIKLFAEELLVLSDTIITDQQPATATTATAVPSGNSRIILL